MQKCTFCVYDVSIVIYDDRVFKIVKKSALPESTVLDVLKISYIYNIVIKLKILPNSGLFNLLLKISYILNNMLIAY